jgi:hypothetical protein
MDKISFRPELEELVKNISTKNTYSGNKISDSIMKMFTVEETKTNSGVLVPYWLGVVEHGRGVRKSNVDSGLAKKIYFWMQRKGMFRSKTEQGKLAEAKAMTWYINHYGNKQFRNKVFVDIFTTERKKTIEKVNEKMDKTLTKITFDIL